MERRASMSRAKDGELSKAVLFLQRCARKCSIVAACLRSFSRVSLNACRSRQLFSSLSSEENMRYLNARLLLTAAIASLGLTTIAFAADLPARTNTKAPEYVPPPACAWCGWYIGANGGGAWDDRTGNLVDFSTNFNNSVPVGTTPQFLGTTHQGGFGGGQFGYNSMMGNVLLG